MKSDLQKIFVLLLSIILLLVRAEPVMAQTFKTLYDFTIADQDPEAILLASSNTIYGTTFGNEGIIFGINVVTGSFTNLYTFTGGFDGREPNSLVLSGGTLYGTASAGGNNSSGTLFKLNMTNSAITILHTFNVRSGSSGTNSDGASPISSLILSGDTLYGATSSGGAFANGAIFAIKTNGTAITNLHSFTGGIDGSYPSGLALSGKMLYGTTLLGGSSNNGTLFALMTNGGGFTNLHTFTAGIDEAVPTGVVVSGNTLFGTAGGGSGHNGAVFKVNIDGTGYTNLYVFTPISAPPEFFGTNSDGAYPLAGVILSGNSLYGMTSSGGSAGYGAIFALNTDGTGFTNLHSFTALSAYRSGSNMDGALPKTGVILSGNVLYGAASAGGNGAGTAFGISLTPQLFVNISSTTNIVLTWPTNVAGFDYTRYTLQSNANFGTTNWVAVLPAPIPVNGQMITTNALSGGQNFYRLIQ